MSWKCPKCAREFARQDQPHFCGKLQTVDDYIQSQDESVRPKLEAVRAVLHAAIPDAEERISWSMPTYRKRRNACRRRKSSFIIAMFLPAFLFKG